MKSIINTPQNQLVEKLKQIDPIKRDFILAKIKDEYLNNNSCKAFICAGHNKCEGKH